MTVYVVGEPDPDVGPVADQPLCGGIAQNGDVWWVCTRYAHADDPQHAAGNPAGIIVATWTYHGDDLTVVTAETVKESP